MSLINKLAILNDCLLVLNAGVIGLGNAAQKRQLEVFSDYRGNLQQPLAVRRQSIDPGADH